MANLCFGTVAFLGSNSGIDSLYSDLLSISETRIGLYDLKEKLSMNYDGDCRYYINEFWIEDDILYVTTETAWDGHEEYFDTLAKQYDLDWCAEFSTDDGWWVVNDDECKVFKVKYYLDAEDSPIGEFIPFESEEEALEFLDNFFGFDKTLEELSELFYNEDEIAELTENDDWYDAYARLWIVEREYWV